LKLGVFILVAALLGASATRTSFAEGAAPSGDHHHGSQNVKPSLKIGAPGNFHARRLPDSGRLKPAERNAIGLAVGEHDGVRDRDDGNHGLPAHISAPTVPDTSAGEVGGQSTSNGGIERSTIARPVTSPMGSAPVVQRGAIAGVSFVRPSSTPSSLGGRAKTVAGLSGTNFRPKHQ
jgi:hypothetical protein